ncbi:MAG: hypothetical protein IH949_01975 [Bacteroidetes bacterium]|nr:hypothetical protein [Bacteroidota bacterium]
MKSVHILINRTKIIDYLVAPIRLQRKELLNRGYKVKFFYKPSKEYLSCDFLLITSKAMLHLLNEKKVIITKPSQTIDFLTLAKTYADKVIWMDTSDSTSVTHFELLPYVDLYLKKQLLKDRILYQKDFVGGRILTFYYKKLFLENKDRKRPSAIKSIMFLEFSITEFRYDNVISHWPYQLDVMIRKGEYLREQNIKTILKAHPDKQAESKDLYNSYFDEIITEPFENVIDYADAYKFTDISTTIFIYSLTTNRPVFLFETSLNYVFSDLHLPLRKICGVINSKISSGSQLIFDEKSFSEELRKVPEDPDAEFIEEYLF